MKRTGLVLLGTLLAGATAAWAGINIPSDGSDGGLYITNNTVINLALAVSGSWDADNSANAGKGIYDSNKWAVVFKYTNIYIAANATVTFSNHPSRAPVVWLVSGDATVNGTVNLDGQSYQMPPSVSEPGPGGFRGGIGIRNPLAAGPGFGPGGGGSSGQCGGSYGSQGENGSTVYGNSSLLPLIGGSGAGGGPTATSGGGGAGGGAILIACGRDLQVAGTVRANGGAGFTQVATTWYSGGGSGGGLRLIAETLTGNGNILAQGGGGKGVGGSGRIRIERVSGSGTQVVTPAPSLIVLDPGATPLIWLPTDGPTARIVSIGGTNAPTDPRTTFGAEGADIQLIQTNTVRVVVETQFAEQTSQVIVRVTPLANSNYSTYNATVQQVVSTNPPVILWRADVPVQLGHSAMQVRVVRP